jgi:putrescine transport system permease protein
VIGIPYLWLLLFFAVPFLIVLMISFAQPGRLAAVHLAAAVRRRRFSLKLNLENYLALFRDSIYAQAF